ncbi:MAG: hypothetical protein U0572_17150 [Phycisphaerales bacterium]
MPLADPERDGFLHRWIDQLAPSHRASLQRALRRMHERRRDREEFLLEACAAAHGITPAELRMLVPSAGREARALGR